jgi:manganese/zinc/iron transport system permease protein
MSAWLYAAASSSALERLWRVVTLQDPNTRTVLLGTSLLGGMAGVVGVFMLLRRRALIGDVVGHAALPGIAGGFLISVMLSPDAARSLPVLLGGAFVAGVLGALCVMLVDRFSRVRSDAALAIVLSAFYGLGVVLLSVVQRVPTGAAAGLGTFLNGKTASLLGADVQLFAAAACLILILTLLFFKEFTLLCFDNVFASANGWPVFLLDGLLITLVAAVTIIGMQSVGLLLVVATLITPAAAARFWTDDIRRLALLAAAFGALSAVVGITLSAAIPHVAAGATIVLVAGLLFVVSLACGARRGALWRWLEHLRLERQIARHDLLRAAYEIAEGRAAPERDDEHILNVAFERDEFAPGRGWSASQRDLLIHWALDEDLLRFAGGQRLQLTSHGLAEARRLVRNHRLWELYLMRYADVAASHVDHTADVIEHVLDPEIIQELEHTMHARRESTVPESPHPIGTPEAASAPAIHKTEP